MQDEVGDMISAGMQSVKLVIRHEREPDERIPQAEIFGAEGPEKAFLGQTGLNNNVF